MNKTDIQYLDYTWNPIAMRCDPVSPGCENCWHLRFANRHAKNPLFSEDIRRAYSGEGPFVLKDKELAAPMKRKKPAVIGVQFMGDLFHKKMPDEWIDRVFAVMALCPQHTFVVLTKREKEMEEYFSKASFRRPHDFPVFGKDVFLPFDGAAPSSKKCWKTTFHPEMFPLPNVILGVSIENQEQADKRIPHLLQTPAACRVVSVEPCLSGIDLSKWIGNVECTRCQTRWIGLTAYCCPGCGEQDQIVSCTAPYEDFNQINGVFCGGESGPGARPMDPDWARSLWDQCKGVDTSFFFKQMSGATKAERENIPDDLMVQEFPNVGGIS